LIKKSDVSTFSLILQVAGPVPARCEGWNSFAAKAGSNLTYWVAGILWPLAESQKIG